MTAAVLPAVDTWRTIQFCTGIASDGRSWPSGWSSKTRVRSWNFEDVAMRLVTSPGSEQAFLPASSSTEKCGFVQYCGDLDVLSNRVVTHHKATELQ